MTLRPARLSDCRGLSVLLAFRDDQENFLIVGEEAIVVDDGARGWWSLPVNNDGGHTGLLVDDVRVEVDITSTFDPDQAVAAGSLIRHGGTLLLWTAGRLVPFSENGAPVAIVAGESGSEDVSIGFSRWHVVRGEDAAKRVILAIDVSR